MNKTIALLFSLFAFLSYAEKPEYFFFSPEMIRSHIENYTEEEKEAILKDLEVVKNVCTPIQEKTSHQKPIYLATAGAPGARKTTILERFMNHYVLSSYMTYLDPDQRALKFMPHTYYSKSLSALSIAKQKNYIQHVQRAYEKWRGASNFITFTLLEEAFASGQNIAHGTTSTGAHIPAFLSKVKQSGYEIILLLCSAQDDLRREAIEYRNTEQKFYQSTPEDAVSKGKTFPMRMHAYFTYGDSLYLFWSDALFEQEHLAATLSNGELKIHNLESLNKFICQFERDREILLQEGQKIPTWNELLDMYRSRF